MKPSTATLRRRYERDASRYLDLPGIRLHYHDEGSGPPLVLVHGSYGSLRSWDHVVAELDAFRCLRWDQPGMGLSTVDPAVVPPNLTAVDVVAQLLDEAEIGTASFVATSSGATLATAFAAAHPGRVERMVIANAPPDPVVFAEVRRPWHVKAVLRFADQVLRHRPAFAWWVYFRSLWGRPELLSWSLVRTYRDFWAARRPTTPPALALRNRSADESKSRLGAVRCPVLLVWGLRDYVLPPETVETYRERLVQADVTVQLLPEVGHYPPLEVPVEFARLVRSFLAGAPSA